nr:hypothetical transcript [Hymenolepis microstoma]
MIATDISKTTIKAVPVAQTQKRASSGALPIKSHSLLDHLKSVRMVISNTQSAPTGDDLVTPDSPDIPVDQLPQGRAK